jgi:acyl carrier protein
VLRGAPRGGRRAARAVEPDAVRLDALPAAERRAHLLELVRTAAAAVLGHDGPHAIDPAKGFLELGFDSLAAVELRNRLGERLDVRLSATLVYDRPTPAEVADFLVVELGGEVEAAPSLEDELARWEMALDLSAPGEEERARVEARLRALVARLALATTEPGDEEAPLDAVTADELFDILDEELETTD